MRKATMVLGLILVIFALVPPAALAKAKGTDRPGRFFGSGITTIEVSNHMFVSDWTGKMAHAGRIMVHAEGTWAVVPAGIQVSGNTETVAANGDRIFGAQNGVHSFPSPSGEFFGEYVVTITGGTGRFEDATGTTTVKDHQVRISHVGSTIVYRVELSGRGVISY